MAKLASRANTSTVAHSAGPADLLAYCPDIHEWSRSWRVLESDIVPGNHIVGIFQPFLLHLIQSGLSRKTIRRHATNLWVLGGKIIRDLNQSPRLRKIPISHLVLRLAQDDGPLLSSADEQDHRSLESTCRRFCRFLADQDH